MASVVSVETKVEVGYVSSEKQFEIQPSENMDTDSVSVEVENSYPGSERITESLSIQHRGSSFITDYMPVLMVMALKFLICCLLFVCFAPVAYAFITVVTVAILSLLLAAFVFLRAFQFISRDEDNEKHALYTYLFRYWMCVVVLLLLVEVGIFYPVAKYVPGLKLVLIIELPITKWIKIICILIGIYLISQFIFIFIKSIVPLVFSDKDDRRFIPVESTFEIIGCLMFLWAEVVVMSSIPTFKQSKIFGIYAHNWIKVSLLVLMGFNIIKLLTHLFVWSLLKFFGNRLEVEDLSDRRTASAVLSAFCCVELGKGAFNRKYVVYIATGLQRSIIFILSMVMLLITWVMYFGNRLDTTPQNKRILEIGTWTMVSLLICSFLWLIKSGILLYWEAHSVYDRLHSKITAIGKQLYFFVMLSPTHYHNIARFPEKRWSFHFSDFWACFFQTWPKIKLHWGLSDTSAEGEVCQKFDRDSVRAELINHLDPKISSLYDIQKAAQLFLAAQYALSKESIVNDLSHLQEDASCMETLMKIVKVFGEPYFDNDWELLLELLPDVNTTEEITLQKVKTFMDRARNSCMFLTNTFICENEVVKCLNQVMSGIIIGGIFIMWLLLTGLASTKLLVVIASPVLAATFIFGDTAKGLFQGLIFVYVVHPFDVGDLCLIDEQLVEVNRISIWSTTFSNVRTVGEQQQVIYPNSVLAQKNVINYKTNFNWNDSIEFLCSPDKKITVALKHKIQTYLDHEKEKFTPNFRSVEIREMGDKAKIVVHIKHNLAGIKGWTNFECLKAKEERRFEFAVYVQNLVKEEESGTEVPESAGMEEFLTKG